MIITALIMGGLALITAIVSAALLIGQRMEYRHKQWLIQTQQDQKLLE